MTTLQRSLDELVGRYALPDGATERLIALLELLADDPTAPTAVREPERILEDHLADSLVALELQLVRTATTLADIGSGAGFPGLPLAIAKPGAAVSLLESNGRKCAFLKRAIAACGLTNASVVNARAEAWPDGLDHFDLITARALASLEVVVEYAAPLLVVGGALVVWRGKRDQASEAAAGAAAHQLAMDPLSPVLVHPYAGARSRHLHVFRKAAETPRGFPRRSGVARKRPLGRPPTPR